MMPEEKEQLLALLNHEHRWCRDAEARDANSDAVQYDDDAAVGWDVTGAFCRLFGWWWACALFGQFERHIRMRRRLHGLSGDAAIESMVTVQAYNDHPGDSIRNPSHSVGDDARVDWSLSSIECVHATQRYPSQDRFFALAHHGARRF